MASAPPSPGPHSLWDILRESFTQVATIINPDAYTCGRSPSSDDDKDYSCKLWLCRQRVLACQQTIICRWRGRRLGMRVPKTDAM